jgi:spermidine/putrescine transport system permease protein
MTRAAGAGSVAPEPTGHPQPPASGQARGRDRVLYRIRSKAPRTVLGLFAVLYLAWSLAPALIAMAFSFNAQKSRSVWQGFSTRWWVGNSDSVLHNPVYKDALAQSFKLAALDVIITVPIGVALAVFLSRWVGFGSRPISLLSALPLVIPELVLAVSLFALITGLTTFIHLGTTAQVIGQVTFSMPFVVVITRGRLASIPLEFEEAGMDLGASPWKVFVLVLGPLLEPAIVASMIVAFAVSIDDFVITQYMASDASTQTVPMLIYNNARGQASPALNATATVMVTVTVIGVALGLAVYRFVARRDSF